MWRFSVAQRHLSHNIARSRACNSILADKNSFLWHVSCDKQAPACSINSPPSSRDTSSVTQHHGDTSLQSLSFHYLITSIPLYTTFYYLPDHLSYDHNNRVGKATEYKCLHVRLYTRSNHEIFCVKIGHVGKRKRKSYERAYRDSSA